MASSTGIHCPDIAFIPKGFVSRKLIMFFTKKGLSNGVAARATNKSDLNLVSRRQSVRKSPHLIEVKTLLSFPESLHKDDDSSLVDYTENATHLPDTETEDEPVPETPRRGRYASKMLKKAVSYVSEPGPSGSLPPHIHYLLDMGFDLEQIKMIARKSPYFVYYSLEGKIRPLIEFLLDHGVPKSDLPRILLSYPSLCGLSLSESLIPKMAFLQTLGLDKTNCGKVICRYPAFFGFSLAKVEATVGFLYDMGLSKEFIGKILVRNPSIAGWSVEEQLRPKAEYFQSFGVDVAVLLRRSPEVMGISMEAKLKPVTEFFLQNGFSKEEIGIMIPKSHARMYTLSLKDNVVPKWEFFLTTHYSKQDLLKCPTYFGYSLEDRIKPRYKLMIESGVKLPLSSLLNQSDHVLEMSLRKRNKTQMLPTDKSCN